MKGTILLILMGGIQQIILNANHFKIKKLFYVLVKLLIILIENQGYHYLI